VGQVRDVSSDVSAINGVLQRLAKHGVDVPNEFRGEAVVPVGPAPLRLAGHPRSAAWTSPLTPLFEFAVERVDLLGG
jgi:hypothetical protein